jgi:hypothetical protein
MYSYQRILVIGVALFIGKTIAEGDDGFDLGFNNQIYWPNENSNRNHETINIDEKPSGSIYYGSGDKFDDRQYDDTEVDVYSGDDSVEGSGYTPEDSCIRLQQQMSSKGLLGVYIPRCTPEGEFERLQCHPSRRQCWCVDKGGREISGSRQTQPAEPNCDEDILSPTRRPGVDVRPVEENRDDIINLSNENSPLPEDHDKQHNNDMDNSINAMPDGNVEIQTVAPDTNQVEGMMSSKGEFLNPSAVMQKPGILAGIIGGAVIGLLCAVLLVMFIVYRMRKKDEGSYALDEKRSPTHHTYQRANTREFYA